MAAALVDQAMQGRYMPLAVVYHKDYDSAKRAFLLYHRLSAARALVFVIFMILPFFEIPAWCNNKLPNPCGDPKKYPLSGLPYIHPSVSLVIQTCCVLILAWTVALQRYFLGSRFWKKQISVYKVALIVAMYMSISASALGIAAHQGFKISMYLRILIPIVYSRAIRGCFRMTILIVHTFLDITVLVVAFVMLSAWLATTLFSESTLEFKDYSTSLLNLFVLLTTANNPTVWATAYRTNRLAFFFFSTYLLVGFFFLMNLAFSVIYSNYKAQMALEVAKRTTARQRNLRAAFSLLDIRHQEWIDGATMISLFLAIGRYRHIPDVRARTSHLFLALNRRGDFKIWSDEFEDLCDVIAKEVESPPDLKQLRRRASRSEMQFVTHPVYSYVTWAFTLGSLAVAITQFNVNGSVEAQLLGLEFLFGWVFAMDALLKACLQGWRVYWRSTLNKFDFIVTMLIVALHFFSLLHPNARPWVSYLIIIRGFRTIALLSLITRWRLMAQTLIIVIPATAPILALQFLVCSVFSLLGVHLFGGLVYEGNPALAGTQYSTLGFEAFNYNDYASAMATSFNLCVVNKWYVIMDGYAAATDSKWSRAFFMAFWAIAVVFTLNVVVAFFTEALTGQMEKAEQLRVREMKLRNAEEVSVSGPPGRKRSGLSLPARTTKSLSYFDLYEDIVKKT
jgi:two pore calcium channel protein